MVAGNPLVIFPDKAAQCQRKQRAVSNEGTEGTRYVITDMISAHKQARHHIADKVGRGIKKLHLLGQYRTDEE